MKVASQPPLPVSSGWGFGPAGESLTQVKRTAVDIRKHFHPSLTRFRLNNVFPQLLGVLLAGVPLLSALSGIVLADQTLSEG